MKLIIQDAAYVEKKDITFVRALPYYVVDEMGFFVPFRDHIEVFRRPDSIKYWESLDAIFDYKELKKLSAEELNNKVKSIKNEIDEMFKQYVSATESQKHTLDMDYGRLLRGAKLNHMYETIKDFQVNPQKYDEMFSMYLK